MSSATLAASASPHSSAIRCSARSMPAVMPALDASGPSTTNTRLSITCARGARARSAWQQLVVRGAAAACRASRLAPRAARPSRSSSRRCGVSAPSSDSPSTSLEPLRGGGDRRRDLAELGASVGRPARPRSACSVARAMDRDRPAPSPTEVDSVATGPAKRSRKRGGCPRASRCRLARRNASAGPAMSSSSECGAMTNRRSIR